MNTPIIRIIRKFFFLSLLLFSDLMWTQLLGENLQPGKYYVNQIKEALETNNKECFTSLFADYLKAPQPCNPCLIKVLSAKPEWFSYALNNGLKVDFEEKLSTVFTDSTEAVQTLINNGHLVEDVWFLAVQSEQMADFLIKKGVDVNAILTIDGQKIELIKKAFFLSQGKNNLYQILRKKGASKKPVEQYVEQYLEEQKERYCYTDEAQALEACRDYKEQCIKMQNIFFDYEIALLKEKEDLLKQKVSFVRKMQDFFS